MKNKEIEWKALILLTLIMFFVIVDTCLYLYILETEPKYDKPTISIEESLNERQDTTDSVTA